MRRFFLSAIAIALVVLCAPPPAGAGNKRTVLLLPFATTIAGFDTSFTIANTTADPFGDKTASGACTFNYFAQNGAAVASQTSNDVPAGAMIVGVFSTGGSHGIQGRPGFQGYVIIDCAFGSAVGTAYVTSGVNFENAASIPLTEIKPKDRK